MVLRPSARLLLKPRFSNRSFASISSNSANVGQNGDGSILFLSPTSWPEPNATAAGTRTTSLLSHFATSASSRFSSVHFGCGAKMPDSLNKENNTAVMHQIKPNRSNEMKDLLQNINDNYAPIRAVVFDRFYAEEAFSFRIRALCPNALLVLDMQDVHSLRIGRQCLVEEMDSCRHYEDDANSDDTIKMSKCLTDKVMEFDPLCNLLPSSQDRTASKKRTKASDTFLRELASVHRSDLVLVCSPVEMKMLERWGVPKEKLVLAPFFCIDDCIGKVGISPTFEDRKDFVSVGGFKHPPNVDSVKLLRNEIWPRIRARLPDARMHVYGAYPTHQIMSLNDEKTGFIVHGQVDDLDQKLSKARVLLAPLRYGAGIKGKIVDAWRNGCPVITTPIGAEGCTDEMDGKESTNETADEKWGGLVVSDTNSFVDAAVKVYEQNDLWASCQENGFHLLDTLFNGRDNLPVVENAIDIAMASLKKRRQQDVFGSLMWHQSTRSTEYFSKWIELKESLQ